MQFLGGRHDHLAGVQKECLIRTCFSESGLMLSGGLYIKEMLLSPLCLALGITSDSSPMLGVTSEPMRHQIALRDWALYHMLSLLDACRVLGSKKQLLTGISP